MFRLIHGKISDARGYLDELENSKEDHRHIESVRPPPVVKESDWLELKMTYREFM